jgi:hypothetical protein
MYLLIRLTIVSSAARHVFTVEAKRKNYYKKLNNHSFRKVSKIPQAESMQNLHHLSDKGSKERRISFPKTPKLIV